MIGFFEPAADHYPGFDQWYQARVLPGLADGTRIILTRQDGSGIYGGLIAKRNGEERKICSLLVRPDRRGKGVASGLIAEAIAWLGDPLPLMTVPGSVDRDIGGLLDRFGFVRTGTVPLSSDPTGIEIIYNGRPGGPANSG